jgi:L-malate glycosyltransferase
MKILHVDTAREWRGGQNQVWLTARGQLSRGHAVRIACASAGRLEARLLAEALDHQSFAFGRGDLSPRSVAALAGVMRAYGPDVVQLHDPHGISAGVLAARLSRFDGALIGTRRVDYPLRGSLSRMKLSACDAVIAVSSAIVEILAESGLPRANTHLVYEGVADRPAVGTRADLRVFGIGDRDFVVGNVAALTEQKDHETLLVAAQRLVAAEPSARVLVFGEGQLRQQLEERAKALGLGAAVVFAGFRPDVERFIPHFDAFCLSSQKEGLGTSLLDAMCFSRPIVATAAGGIPEVVIDGVNGRLVPVKDPEKLAAGLIEVLRASPEQRQRWGAAGRERFLASFSVERMVDETLGVYDGALSTR